MSREKDWLTPTQRRALELSAMFDALYLTAKELRCSGSAAYSLVCQGLFKQQGSKRSAGYEYRITAAGRESLREVG